MYSYPYGPYLTHGWMPRSYTSVQGGFENYDRFIADLKKAIHGEASAIEYYKKLLDMSDTEFQKAMISHIYQDEIKHLRMFSRIYTDLTGMKPQVQVTEPDFAHYKDGIKQAFLDELEAAEFYRRMYLATRYPQIRDSLFEAMTDEMEHAQRLTFLYHQ